MNWPIILLLIECQLFFLRHCFSINGGKCKEVPLSRIQSECPPNATRLFGAAGKPLLALACGNYLEIHTVNGSFLSRSKIPTIVGGIVSVAFTHHLDLLYVLDSSHSLYAFDIKSSSPTKRLLIYIRSFSTLTAYAGTIVAVSTTGHLYCVHNLNPDSLEEVRLFEPPTDELFEEVSCGSQFCWARLTNGLRSFIRIQTDGSACRLMLSSVNFTFESMMTNTFGDTIAFDKRRGRMYRRHGISNDAFGEGWEFLDIHINPIDYAVTSQTVAVLSATGSVTSLPIPKDWEGWSPCSENCGSGTRTRTRHFRICQKVVRQTEPCQSEEGCGVPVNGGWGAWGEWSQCSTYCGMGSQRRYRYCDNPVPKFGGKVCAGMGREWKPCMLTNCSGHYLALLGKDCQLYCRSLGLACQSFVETGNSLRVFSLLGIHCSASSVVRRWSQPYHPSVDVATGECQGYVRVPNPIRCDGNDLKAAAKHRRLCNCVRQDEIGLSSWLQWTPCTHSCGGGTQTRDRFCLLKAPCYGSILQQRKCNDQRCPVDGGFTSWTEWSACSRSCNTGTRYRRRFCLNPVPAYGGKSCHGIGKEQNMCNVHYCPRHGGLTSWTSWSHCNAPCNGGVRERYRDCSNPVPLFGGRPCHGETMEFLPCNFHSCREILVTATANLTAVQWKHEFADPEANSSKRLTLLIRKNVKDIYASFIYDSLQSLEAISYHVVATLAMKFNYLNNSHLALLKSEASQDKDKKSSRIGVHFLSFLVEDHGATLTPPLNLTGYAIDAHRVHLCWSHKSTVGIRGFLVILKEADSVTAPYRLIGAHAQSIDLYHLTPDTRYAFRIASFSYQASGDPSKEIIVRTLQGVPSQDPGPVSAASSLNAGIRVSWSHVPDHAVLGTPRGYLVRYKSVKTLRIASVNVSAHSTQVILSGLLPLQEYLIEVAIFNSRYLGPFARTSVRTQGSAPPIPVQSNISLDKSNFRLIRIHWVPVSLEARTGYSLFYVIAYRIVQQSGERRKGNPWQHITVHGGDTSYSFLADPFTTYAIKIAAANEFGIGIFTAELEIEICRCPARLFSNFWLTEPFFFRNGSNSLEGFFKHVTQTTIPRICGSCPNYHLNTTVDLEDNGKGALAEKSSMERAIQDIDTRSELSFPISQNPFMETFLQGFPFVSIFTSRGIAFIVVKPSLQEKALSILQSILAIWPLSALILVFITISGITLYALEPKGSNIDLRGNCLLGSCDGIWWAFITMGTLGYGDITPKGKISRLFAIVWILFGLITFSLLIGSVTSALTSWSIGVKIQIFRTEVAAIDGSVEYKIALRRGAKVNTKRRYKTLRSIRDALLTREVRGALVEGFTATSRIDLFKHPELTVQSVVSYPLGIGMVLSGRAKYLERSIRDYVKANERELDGVINGLTSPLESTPFQNEAKDLFDSKSPMLLTSLLVLASLLFGTVMVISILQYLWRCRRKKDKQCVQEEVARLKSLDALDDLVSGFVATVPGRLRAMEFRHKKAVFLSRLYSVLHLPKYMGSYKHIHS